MFSRPACAAMDVAASSEAAPRSTPCARVARAMAIAMVCRPLPHPRSSTTLPLKLARCTPLLRSLASISSTDSDRYASVSNLSHSRP